MSKQKAAAKTTAPKVTAPADPALQTKLWAQQQRQKNQAKYGPAPTTVKGTQPGAPTPAEYAKLDQRLQQALAAQKRKAAA